MHISQGKATGRLSIAISQQPVFLWRTVGTNTFTSFGFEDVMRFLARMRNWEFRQQPASILADVASCAS